MESHHCIYILFFYRRNERDDRRSRAASVLSLANNSMYNGRGSGGVGRQSAAAIRESIAQSWFQNQSNSTSNGSHPSNRRAMYNDTYDEIIGVSTPEKRTVKRVRKVRKGNRPNLQILAVMDGSDDVSVLTETQRLAPSVHDVTKDETDEAEEEKSVALF